jgi:hypothetical protein
MPPVFRTAASQETDVRGSEHLESDLNVADEQQQLGVPVGPAGSTASIISINGSDLTIVGLTGMTADTQGYSLQLFNAADPNNIGNFPISEVLSSNSVVIVNGAGSAPDGNNGSIVWMLRYPYSLEADLNYERSDRKAIKGVDYYQTVAPYQRPDAIGTDIPTNLTNISGKTTDAVAYPGSRELYGLLVMSGQSSIVVFDPGQLKHMDPVDTLGIPCFDVAPFIGDFENCFVKILDGYLTGIEFTVISGPHAGERIFGVTANGSSVSPDSVQINFYSCPLGADITMESSPYTWEVGQTNIINIIYGFNQRADSFDFNIFRLPITIPIVPSGTGQFLTPYEHQTLRQLIHFIDEGPGDGFISGAYKVTLPSPSVFPTSIIWYEDNTMTKIIVSKTIIWSGVVPITITWQVYNVDGVTVAHTVSDSITYTSNIFESTRTRTIS